jgi:hypothetical protein
MFLNKKEKKHGNVHYIPQPIRKIIQLYHHRNMKSKMSRPIGMLLLRNG